MRYSPLLLFLLLFQVTDLTAQYYSTGQDPASLKWMRIKGEKFDVIYPESYGNKGADFARLLDSSYSSLTPLFSSRKQKIPVVIHNYSTRANGYVAWAPRRMELYPAPDQSAIPGNQHWLLTTHETTHIFEMEGLKSGLSGLLAFLFGEQLTGALAAYLPSWYLEGNAVVSETLLSSSGRGRTPSFHQQLKAIALTEGNYSYDKMFNGSYRDYVPDHYQYGYQMTAWAMAKYDPLIWTRVLRTTAEQALSFNPVNKSLRRSAGLTKKRLYEEAFDSLTVRWEEETSEKKEEYRIVNPPKGKEYINYQSPVAVGKDSVVAIRSSMSETTSIVLITGGREKILHKPGSIYPPVISHGKGKITWVENRPDPRWANRNYNVIRMLDINTRKVSNASGKARYLATSISPDGMTLAAVENTPENTNNLVFLDARTGAVISGIPVPGNADIQRPQWSFDGAGVTVLYTGDEGEGILGYKVEENRWVNLLQAQVNDIQSSVLKNDSLYFISSESGTDNVWIRTPDGNLMQITDSRFGTGDLSLTENTILFSNYSSTGNNISEIQLSNFKSRQKQQSGRRELIDRIDDVFNPGPSPAITGYQPIPFRKWQHLFRFHSWMPFYADLDKIQSDPLSIRPGLTLMSQNILSTLFTTLGYEYTADRRHIIRSEISYHGFYPVITASLDHGYRPSVLAPQSILVPTGTRFRGGISFPFSFTSGYFNHYLRFSLDGEYANNIYPVSESIFDYGQTNFTGRAYFTNYSRQAYREILPRWAQTVDISRIIAPYDEELFGSSTIIRTSFIFPGLLENHGLRLRLEIERQQQANFLFTNRISFPRGYDNMPYPDGYRNIVTEDLKVATADYVFPLFYPDFNIASLLYVKRIRSGLFFDYARGTGNRYYGVNEQGRMVLLANNNFSESFRSYGAELIADFHILRIPFMISGGVQAAWKSTHELPVLSGVFRMDLYGFSLGK